MDELANAIKDYGFPLIASIGLGYFVYFIRKWVTETIDPVVGGAMGTLIALVDRIRMLDNDMIRLNTKLSMLLEHYDKEGKPIDGDVEKILQRYGSRHEEINSNRSTPNNNTDT